MTHSTLIDHIEDALALEGKEQLTYIQKLLSSEHCTPEFLDQLIDTVSFFQHSQMTPVAEIILDHPMCSQGHRLGLVRQLPCISPEHQVGYIDVLVSDPQTTRDVLETITSHSYLIAPSAFFDAFTRVSQHRLFDRELLEIYAGFGTKLRGDDRVDFVQALLASPLRSQAVINAIITQTHDEACAPRFQVPICELVLAGLDSARDRVLLERMALWSEKYCLENAAAVRDLICDHPLADVEIQRSAHEHFTINETTTASAIERQRSNVPTRRSRSPRIPQFPSR